MRNGRAARAELEALTDALLDGYVTWREESDAVAAMYRRWSNAAPADRGALFAAYEAALDREEDAAAEYKRLLDWATAEYQH